MPWLIKYPSRKKRADMVGSDWTILDIDPVPSYILLHRSVKAFPVKSSSHLPIGLTSADLHAEKDAQIVRSPLGKPFVAICRSSVQYPDYL